MFNRALRAILTVSMISTLGCAASYTPREPGRISFLGNELVKDGKHFDIGLISSEPEEAVAGNPAAEEEARKHVRRKRIGGILYLLSIGSLGGAIALHPVSGEDVNRSAAGMALLLVAAPAFLIASLIALNSSQGPLYDAVNIYNDGVWQGASKGTLPIGR